MKSILLLGGSRQQVPAIETAKRLGYRTVLIDYLSENPGQFVADKWYQESTTDVESVYRIAKDEQVSGILAYASDPAAFPAALVCERLGLPTNPVKAVEILGVKHKFREFLKENSFACPATFTFSPATSLVEVQQGIENMRFPIVVKPTDSSGSKGVSFLNDSGSLATAITYADCYSRNKILIAEEFIERIYPYVIGGDIFVESGKIVLFGDMECLRGDHGKSLIPIGKKRPNGLSDRQKKRLYSELQRLVDALNVRFGEFNIEVLVGRDDSIHFLEVGPRAGGNMIPIQLSDAFGVDLIEANIKICMGESVELNPVSAKGAFMTYVLHSNVDGIFSGISIAPELKSAVYRQVIYKRQGDRVEAFDGAGKAVGIVFLHFSDKSAMDLAEIDIESKILVDVL
ncbi:ATP-grasp domain-containing protein [Coprobacter secundus]|uniref:ATP-grasp domain-containing protein n=1 Tax=Coprobacter secundus TaxID=1501392 RepID=UPI0023F85CAE|nr:ATP-grasp domain-containing protein [Coprobacter secundus]